MSSENMAKNRPKCYNKLTKLKAINSKSWSPRTILVIDLIMPPVQGWCDFAHAQIAMCYI